MKRRVIRDRAARFMLLFDAEGSGWIDVSSAPSYCGLASGALRCGAVGTAGGFSVVLDAPCGMSDESFEGEKGYLTGDSHEFTSSRGAVINTMVWSCLPVE